MVDLPSRICLGKTPKVKAESNDISGAGRVNSTVVVSLAVAVMVCQLLLMALLISGFFISARVCTTSEAVKA